jgi:hypothetical protein
VPSISIDPSKTVPLVWTIPVGSTTPFSFVQWCANPASNPDIRVSFTTQTSPTAVTQIPAGLTVTLPAIRGANGAFNILAPPLVPPAAQGCTTGPLANTGGPAVVSALNILTIPQVFTFTQQNASGVTTPLVTITVPSLGIGSSTVELDPDTSINIRPSIGIFNAQLPNVSVPSILWEGVSVGSFASSLRAPGFWACHPDAASQILSSFQ